MAAPIGGIHGYRLDPEDHLIHVALHCGLGGANRLGGLRDVHVTVGTSDLDWDVVASRAVRYGAGPIVGQVLDRSRLLLGTPMDASIPSRMAPEVGLATRAMLDRLSLRGHSDRVCSGFAVAVARRGVPNTIGSAFELVRDRVAVAMGMPRRWSAHDPDGPLSGCAPPAAPTGWNATCAWRQRQADGRYSGQASAGLPWCPRPRAAPRLAASVRGLMFIFMSRLET